MPHPRPLFLSLLAAAAFLVAVPEALAGRPRYADPREPGLYGVGHTVFDAVDEARDGRTLRTELWYPTEPGTTGTPTFYDFQFFGLGLISPVAFEGVPPTPDVAFPLIVFSHGSGGVSWQSTFLMERLASHGFVVVAPNHTGNTANDVLGGTSTPFAVSARNRPLDVSFVIDLLLERNLDPLDPLYLKINPLRIGAAGHSFGGFTSLALAGGYVNEAAGTDLPPDPRVRAIAPIAPASGGLADAQLAAVDVPMFLLSGTLDTTTPIDDDTTRPFDLAEGRPIYRADVVDATHLHFANACDIGGVLVAFGVPLENVERTVRGYTATCLPPALPIDEVKRVQSAYLTAFFKRHLYGDPAYDELLTDAYAAANEPGVIWFRKDASAPE